ncbi:MAG TPA: iron-sulfur cluster assembly scaffold protein [Actinomycetota bacterium]|nr:iron-sulfur cluster assembly scaffold protein [Actinomycetota bacterium]
MYSAQLLDRFYHPRWVGNVAAPDAPGSVPDGMAGVPGSVPGGRAWASATEGNPTCGDVVQIDIEVAGGMIAVARFRTLGCAVAIAASDALCDLATGQTVTAAQFLHVDEVIAALGGIPPRRESCASAPMAALRSALFSLSAGRGGGRRTTREPAATPPGGR